jgi:hypothetical protein
VIAASPFARTHSPDCAEASAAIKSWVRKRFALKERNSVAVSEVVCRDPDRAGAGLEGWVQIGVKESAVATCNLKSSAQPAAD